LGGFFCFFRGPLFHRGDKHEEIDRNESDPDDDDDQKERQDGMHPGDQRCE